MNEEKPLLTAKEFARLTGLGLNRVYELMNRDDFPCIQFGRRKYVSRKGFYEWLDKQVSKKIDV